MRSLITIIFAAATTTFVFAEEIPDTSDDSDRPPVKGEKLDEIDFSSISKGTGILPIPSGPDKSEKLETIAPRKLQRINRLIVEPAKERVKGKPFAQEAEIFLRDMADYLAWYPSKDHSPLYLQARRLAELGWSDPVFFCWMGDLLKAEGHDSEAWFSRAAHDAAEVKANIGEIGLYAYTRMAYRTPGEDSKRNLLRWLKELGAAENVKAEEGPELMKVVGAIASSLQGRGMDDEIIQVLKESALPDWVKLTVIGRMEIRLAWRSRGSDWSANVTDKGWDGFSEHLKKARTALTAAWEANPDQPYASASMVTVTMGDKSGDIEELQKWFHRSVVAKFDQSDAYEFFLSAIRSRWGGSARHVLTFGKACMDTERFETQVPKFFLLSLESIARDLPDWRVLYSEPAIKKEIDSFFTKSLAKITDPKIRASEQGQAGVFAWFTGDFKKAESHFTQGKFSSRSIAADMLRRASSDIGYASASAKVLAGSGAEDFVTARDAAKSGKWDEAVTALKRCAEKYQASSFVTRFLKTELALAEFGRSVETGNWTVIPIGEQHSGWSPITGKWTIKHGSIQMRGDEKESRIVFNGIVPDEFEMRGNYSFSAAAGIKHRDIGFLLRHTGLHNTAASPTWSSVRLWKFFNGTQFADVRRKFGKADPQDPNLVPTEFKDSGTFVVRRTKKGAGLTIDGKVIFADRSLPDDAENGRPHIGFGTYRTTSGLSVEFTNLELRKVESAQ
jgi:hypothetical protein